MNTDVRNLVQVLEQLLDTARALQHASKIKCSALASMDLSRINEATTREEELLEHVRELNNQRRAIVSTITGEEAAASGTDIVHDGSLARLLASLKDPERARISVLREELGDVMKDLQFVNITNSIISRRSLRHYRGLLDLLSGGGPLDHRYNRRGTFAKRSGTSSLVNQTA